jgi:hypothetical protein
MNSENEILRFAQDDIKGQPPITAILSAVRRDVIVHEG